MLKKLRELFKQLKATLPSGVVVGVAVMVAVGVGVKVVSEKYTHIHTRYC